MGGRVIDRADVASGRRAVGVGRINQRTILTPGSFTWLLRHELRLALRGTGTRTRWVARNLPSILLATVPTIGGVALAYLLRDTGPFSDRAVARMLGFVGAGVVTLLVLMISTAAIAVLRTFHDRHDLDLLMSSPVPSATILAATAVGVAVTVAAPFALFVGPFALASAVFGEPRWLGGLVMVGVNATVATSIALGLTSLMFGAIGARRARTIIQLGAAVMGGAVFLISQLGNVSPALTHRLYLTVTRRWPSPLDWPARAAAGEPLPLAAMIAFAGLAAWSAARFGAHHLAASADTGTSSRSVVRAGPVRFRTGLARIIVTKELRLIVRDPELITQIALRLVYLIPMAALVLRGRDGVDPGPAVAAAATAFAGLLASSLAWIIVCAEDAPDLLAAAPLAAATVERAKLVAACLAPVALIAVASAAIIGSAPWAAAVTLVMGVVAALTAALLQAWFGKVQPRAAFRRRRSGSFVVGLGQVALAGAWSGTATLLAHGSIWTIAPALFGCMIMAGAIEARRDTARV